MSKKCKVVCCTIAVLLLVPVVVSAGGENEAEGCYAIIVGREASADGSVILAHNEDDGPPQVVNHYKVPRMKHPPAAEVTLINGGKLDQVEQTWSYLWSEMPGLLFSDSYLNEWGVCVTSDACRSREDKPELTDGGISYMLRRFVAERARSAREGVHIAATLVERFGYDGSGRTYSICDPDEGWLFCVVNGKHWLASRVPDDQVACIANTYSVRQVNLIDTMSCLASNDIVEYAIQRGWYDPDVDGPFDFAATYADPETASDIRNYARQWSGLRHIASEPVELSAHLPTTVTPKRKMDVAMVMKILRDHYDGTELDVVDSATGNPHDAGVWTICNSSTQTSFVAQLRRDMPLETGLCWWVCLGSPCQSVYIPFHFGISQFPESYAGESQTPSETYYNMMLQDPMRVKNPEAFWLFKSVGYRFRSEYAEHAKRLRAQVDGLESRLIEAREKVEAEAGRLLADDPQAAADHLAAFSQDCYFRALEALERVVNASGQQH
jgi:dipeptidase